MNTNANTVTYAALIADFDSAKADSASTANRKIQSAQGRILAALRATFIAKLVIGSAAVGGLISLIWVFAV